MSRIRRRSGNAVTEFCSLIEWVPDVVFQVGVGHNHDETLCFEEHWPDVLLIGCDPIHVKDYPGLFHDCLISRVSGEVPFFYLKGHQDGSSMFEPPPRNNPVLDRIVQSRPLSDFSPGGNCLLWLDCEGAEYEALASGKEFLRGVKMVNVEMTGYPRTKQWPRPLEVHGILVRNGFFKTWVHTTRSCRGQFDAIYVKKELFDPRFCSDPGEHRRWIEEQQ